LHSDTIFSISAFSFSPAIGSGSVCDARGAVNEILTGPMAVRRVNFTRDA